MKKFDITILTEARYFNPVKMSPYIQNVLFEDYHVIRELEKRGLKVTRRSWDDISFKWEETDFTLFRTTWNYFDRFAEFSVWLKRVSAKTNLINSSEIIRWNLDKHYLLDLKQKGINIPPTVFIEAGEKRSLDEIARETGWNDFIIKPAVSGAARHTYRFYKSVSDEIRKNYDKLILKESMMLQEFQHSILSLGEVAFMAFEGKFSHAVLKRAGVGDFRVQDDYGGTIENYTADLEEITFIEKVISACDITPVYARVDIIRDNFNALCVSELELIEPELWFRMNPSAVERFADAILNYINSKK